MNLNDIPIFAALTRRMDWLAARQRVLGQNIANSDTPGYRPRDLKPLSFADLVRQPKPTMGLARSRPAHLAGTADEAGRYRPREQRGTYESAPEGNAVVLEEQVLKVTQTRMAYVMTTSLYRKHLDMLRTALGSNR